MAENAGYPPGLSHGKRNVDDSSTVQIALYARNVDAGSFEGCRRSPIRRRFTLPSGSLVVA
jgi:hypothetical protein